MARKTHSKRQDIFKTISFIYCPIWQISELRHLSFFLTSPDNSLVTVTAREPNL